MDYKLAFSTFTIFYTVFDHISWSNPTMAGWISNGCILLFIGLNYRIYKNVKPNNYTGLNVCALIFSVIIIYSGYQNANLSFDIRTWDGQLVKTITATRSDHAVYEALKFFSYLLYFQYLNRVNKDRLFLKYFFYLFMAYTMVSDVNAIVYNSSDGSGYLVGDKFYVCYNNIMLAALYYMLHPVIEHDITSKRRLKFILFFSLVISLKTQCSTAVIGSVIMYFLIFKTKVTWKVKLYKIQTYLLFLFIFNILFFFFTAAFINNPIMEFIIVDILGEDLTLTGRLGIYAALANLLQDCPLWGYGLGNAHLFTKMSGIGPNAQNGLFNLMLEVGILGCIAYVLMMIKMLKLSMGNRFSYPIICLIYTMLVLSSIEITFSIVTTVMYMMLVLNNNPYSSQRSITIRL